jgi:hypothetical protein
MKEEDLHKVPATQTNGDSHHAKTSFRLVKTIAVFLFPTVKTALKGKRFQDVKNIKKNEGRTERCSFGGLC